MAVTSVLETLKQMGYHETIQDLLPMVSLNLVKLTSTTIWDITLGTIITLNNNNRILKASCGYDDLKDAEIENLYGKERIFRKSQNAIVFENNAQWNLTGHNQ